MSGTTKNIDKSTEKMALNFQYYGDDLGGMLYVYTGETIADAVHHALERTKETGYKIIDINVKRKYVFFGKYITSIWTEK